MERGNIIEEIILFTKENSKMENITELEKKFSKINPILLAHFMMGIKNMVNLYLKMAVNIKENF